MPRRRGRYVRAARRPACRGSGRARIDRDDLVSLAASTRARGGRDSGKTGDPDHRDPVDSLQRPGAPRRGVGAVRRFVENSAELGGRVHEPRDTRAGRAPQRRVARDKRRAKIGPSFHQAPRRRSRESSADRCGGGLGALGLWVGTPAVARRVSRPAAEGLEHARKEGDTRFRSLVESVRRGRALPGLAKGSPEEELQRALQEGWAPRETERGAALRDAVGRVSGFLERSVRAPLTGIGDGATSAELRERIGRALGALEDLDFFIQEIPADRQGTDLGALVQRVSKEFVTDRRGRAARDERRRRPRLGERDALMDASTWSCTTPLDSAADNGRTWVVRGRAAAPRSPCAIGGRGSRRRPFAGRSTRLLDLGTRPRARSSAPRKVVEPWAGASS